MQAWSQKRQYKIKKDIRGPETGRVCYTTVGVFLVRVDPN